jgi:hypothetical protein
MKVILLMIAIPIASMCAISMKTSQFALNDYVNLSSGVKGSWGGENSQLNLYPCTTSAIGRDFFINYIDISTCICKCPSGAVGSPRPFYQSKKPFYSMNFDKPLNFKDTTAFTEIDTIRKFYYDTTTCRLPFIILGRVESVIIATITSNYQPTRIQYALIHLKPIITTVKCYDYPTDPGYDMSHLGGYMVTWYVQDNGTADFHEVDQSGIIRDPEKICRYNLSEVSPKTEYYSLLGCKVRETQIQRKISSCGFRSVYIMKMHGNLRLILK